MYFPFALFLLAISAISALCMVCHNACQSGAGTGDTPVLYSLPQATHWNEGSIWPYQNQGCVVLLPWLRFFFGQSTFHWKTKTFKKWTCGKERVLTVLPIQESLIGTKFRDLKYSILIFWKEHLFWNDFCFTCFNIYRRVHYLLKRSK